MSDLDRFRQRREQARERMQQRMRERLARRAAPDPRPPGYDVVFWAGVGWLDAG